MLLRITAVLVVVAVPVAIAASRGSSHRKPDPPSPARHAHATAVKLYVDPNNPAAVQAAVWRQSGDLADAGLINRIASRPTAHWLANGTDPQAGVATLTGAAAAAHTTALLVLYEIPGRDCGGYSSGGAPSGSAYLSWVSAVARGIASRPVIVILEPDAVDQAADGCLSAGAAADRYGLLARATAILKAQPHARVYIDGGHAAWLPPATVAAALRKAGVARADGFALNVSNFQTTAASVAYGRSISRRIGGRHFVIDTSRNGNGPPSGRRGVDSWCNPPGRALGAPPTTQTGIRLVDALLWVKYPGDSDGSCRAGEPPAGSWWPAYALALARG